MTTLTPITVQVEVKPQRTFLDVNPLQNQVAVTEDKTKIEVRSPGIQGANGNNDIGGKPIVISSLAAGDLLQFGGSAWVNTPQENITDGGNF
jgi:hypothetical protein